MILRDLTFGYAAYLMGYTEGDEPFVKVYLGSLGTVLLDLWWRAGLVSVFREKGSVDEASAREGIITYDMDLLDLPSLGGFI
jgi:hypothetical protein